MGSSITDEEFVAAGAKIADDHEQVWGEAEMILKVKEPIAIEYERMRPGQILFTYLHLAASRRVHPGAARRGRSRRSRTRRCSCPTARCRCWRR